MYIDKLQRRYAPESHWYLWTIGVDPLSQGRGIGGRLIEPILARASADGVACYLETGTEKNVRFYEKHGFTVISEGRVLKQGGQIWAMLREATSA